MPKYEVTVYYEHSKTVEVESRGPQSAATKAVKAAKELDAHHPPEVSAAEVTPEGEEAGMGTYFDRIGGRWIKDGGGWLE